MCAEENFLQVNMVFKKHRQHKPKLTDYIPAITYQLLEIHLHYTMLLHLNTQRFSYTNEQHYEKQKNQTSSWHVSCVVNVKGQRDNFVCHIFPVLLS